MPYYHIYIAYTDKKGKERSLFQYNFSEERVKKVFSVPYMNNKNFLFCKKVLKPSDIEKFAIYRSEKKFNELILPNGEPIIDADNDYIAACFDVGKVEGVSGCDSKFITSIPEEKPIKPSTEEFGKKEKVFIVHGRDDMQALLLQKYLKDKLKIDAVMFDDLPDKGRTIIEQLEYIRKNICYAFVIVTPDDLGCLREYMNKLATKLEGRETVNGETMSKIFETLHTRARQNVVFELGLFIGALGRDKVCCLLKQDTDEKPSDIDGILYKSFNTLVKEIFHEIADELKED